METIIETIVNANVGDYVIRALTTTGEEYVLTAAKFPKNYVPSSATEEGVDEAALALGFKKYAVVEESRRGILVTRELLDAMKREFAYGFTPIPPSQDSFFNYMQRYSTVAIKKSGFALARVVTKEEEIVTRTQKGNTPEFKFVASWGTDMVVAENDILVMKADEVYRISRAEFDQTYKFE